MPMNTRELNTYLSSQYLDGGRGDGFYDCWGLVREVRHLAFGKSLLPSYGAINANDKKSLTNAANYEKRQLSKIKAKPGAIATCWRGQLCLHVGIVVENNGLFIMDISETKGCRAIRLSDFEQEFLKVEYYD